LAVPPQSQTDSWNQIAFLSNKEDPDSTSMIGLTIFSVSPEKNVEQVAETNRDAYHKLYENSEYKSTDLLPITIGGYQGVHYIDTIKKDNKTFYRDDIFFYIGDYSYNLSITLKQTDEELVERVVKSFVAEELDIKEIGQLIEPQILK
jgi:hypothetical protein